MFRYKRNSSFGPRESESQYNGREPWGKGIPVGVLGLSDILSHFPIEKTFLRRGPSFFLLGVLFIPENTWTSHLCNLQDLDDVQSL